MKKLVAYSSISHMGFVTWVSSCSSRWGRGCAGADDLARLRLGRAMFLCIGVMYDRVHSRQIADYGGVVTPCPSSPRFFMLLCHGQCRPAGHLRLVGEFMVILGAVKFNFWSVCRRRR